MAVDDSGLEAIRKAAEQVTPGDASDYYIKVTPFGSFAAPALADAVSAEYPNNTTEIYKFRQGGLSGTVLMTITVTYTTASKAFLSGVVKT